MYRSDCELSAYVRHHIAQLANDRRSCAVLGRSGAEPAHKLAGLRRRLGLGLIQLGSALAGSDATRVLPASPLPPARRFRHA
jgi:hypothetical protein